MYTVGSIVQLGGIDYRVKRRTPKELRLKIAAHVSQEQLARSSVYESELKESLKLDKTLADATIRPSMLLALQRLYTDRLERINSSLEDLGLYEPRTVELEETETINEVNRPCDPVA